MRRPKIPDRIRERLEGDLVDMVMNKGAVKGLNNAIPTDVSSGFVKRTYLLTREIEERLRRYCFERRISASEVVRRALSEFLEREERSEGEEGRGGVF